jgi:hypothetical protein
LEWKAQALKADNNRWLVNAVEVSLSQLLCFFVVENFEKKRKFAGF